MDYLEYKGYKGTVEYSKEDDCLVGKVIGMHKDLIAYEGATLAELKMDFEAAVESYIEGCLADGTEPRKPFSGKLILRMSSDLHGRVAMAASANGTTINEFITRTLASAL
jgi:predicted HicB family RNase H-like nuclease